MKKRILYILLLAAVSVSAQVTYWWGAAVGLGHEQPYTDQPLFDLNTQDANNQLVPLFLSSDGEYMWSDKAFKTRCVTPIWQPRRVTSPPTGSCLIRCSSPVRNTTRG